MLYGSLPVLGSVPMLLPWLDPTEKKKKTRETDTDPKSVQVQTQSNSHQPEQPIVNLGGPTLKQFS